MVSVLLQELTGFFSFSLLMQHSRQIFDSTIQSLILTDSNLIVLFSLSEISIIYIQPKYKKVAYLSTYSALLALEYAVFPFGIGISLMFLLTNKGFLTFGFISIGSSLRLRIHQNNNEKRMFT